MKKLCYTLLVFLFFFNASMQGKNEETGETNQSSSEVALPTDYFNSSSSSGDEYQEESTTEGPDGPPAPIDDWIPVFFILGVALVSKHYLYTKKRV